MGEDDAELVLSLTTCIIFECGLGPLGEDHPNKVILLKNWLVHLNIILLSYYNDLGSLCEDDADLFEHLHTSRII